jgi:hypothetical protein
MRRPSLASSGVISAVRKTIGTPCSIQSDSPELRTVSPTANRRVSSLMMSKQYIPINEQCQPNDQNRIDPFQSETLPAGRERERRLLDLSYPAKERLCEVPLARHDGDRRHHQWLPFSSDAPARWPKEPLAQSGPEAERSCARRGRRHRHASDYTCGRKTETYAAGRSAQSSRCPEARKLWSDIACRDWIQWTTSAKQPETRARRIKNACSMLAAGKRRVCCFDRSGLYSKSLSAPKAAT